MKTLPLLLATLIVALTPFVALAGKTGVAVQGDQILVNGKATKLIGLRCSNALMSDESTRELIEALPLYQSYGLNTFSVFVMGSRFGDIKGYLPDGSLNPIYRDRLENILKAADHRGMVVIVGCLYWGTSRAKQDLSGWTQKDADTAIANTARWLKEKGFTNVILDPDNEGMTVSARKWSIEAFISAAKAANPALVVANNSNQQPSNEDLNMHFGRADAGKPWFDSEATPDNVPGGYWGSYSKKSDAYGNYSRIGRYTEEMKADQLRRTRKEIDHGNGYIFASTWLQCAPIAGKGRPFTKPGGKSMLGSVSDKNAPWNEKIDTLHPDAGILWWLEFVKEHYGPKK